MPRKIAQVVRTRSCPDNSKSDEASTYDSAWDENIQGAAALRQLRRELFYNGMSGGISVKGDAGDALRFIPTPGRKKQTTAAAPAGNPVTPPETADDDQISEYADADCPDQADDVGGFIDSENEEDEVIPTRRSTRSGTRSGAGPSDA